MITACVAEAWVGSVRTNWIRMVSASVGEEGDFKRSTNYGHHHGQERKRELANSQDSSFPSPSRALTPPPGPISHSKDRTHRFLRPLVRHPPNTPTTTTIPHPPPLTRYAPTSHSSISRSASLANSNVDLVDVTGGRGGASGCCGWSVIANGGHFFRPG